MPRFFITNIDEVLRGVKDPEAKKEDLRKGIKAMTEDLLGVEPKRQEVIFRAESDPDYTTTNVEIHVIPENYEEEALRQLPGLIQRLIWQLSCAKSQNQTFPDVKAYLVEMVCHTSSKAKRPFNWLIQSEP